ncbi:MAG: sortase [Candidatus Doudnabacteria bacterium]|nr:sortase [Candidatus Doudnabacteria bacterium]
MSSQKNNIPENLLVQNVLGSKRSWTVWAVRSIFIGLIVGVLALAASNSVLQLNITKEAPASAAFLPHPAPQVLTVNAPDPSLLSIPSLKLSAPFEPLGLNPDHTIAVPKNNMGVGWFVYGAKPGQNGAAIIVGHLDSASGPAIFASLQYIKPGDKIFITRADGSVVTYRVDSLAKFPQNRFPTQAIYGAISYPGLRIITCSGTWNKTSGHYSDNLVVFGTEI